MEGGVKVSILQKSSGHSSVNVTRLGTLAGKPCITYAWLPAWYLRLVFIKLNTPTTPICTSNFKKTPRNRSTAASRPWTGCPQRMVSLSTRTSRERSWPVQVPESDKRVESMWCHLTVIPSLCLTQSIAGRHHRWDSIVQHPHQQRLQGILLPHQGTATYTRMHRRRDCTNSDQLNCWCPIRILQFSIYCMAPLISNINKIQRVINRLARVVTGTGKRDHTTSVLKELHWLPVQSRITFALITYKTHLSKKRIISRSCCPSKLHQEHSDLVLQIVYTLMFLGVFLQVAPSVLQPSKFGTVSRIPNRLFSVIGQFLTAT